MSAVATLIRKIATGDLDEARQWAFDSRASLTEMRSNGVALSSVAHACNQWGAEIVWPWGDSLQPSAAQRRVLVAIRAGRPWRASEDTVAVLIACRWAAPNAQSVWAAL